VLSVNGVTVPRSRHAGTKWGVVGLSRYERVALFTERAAAACPTLLSTRILRAVAACVTLGWFAAGDRSCSGTAQIVSPAAICRTRRSVCVADRR